MPEPDVRKEKNRNLVCVYREVMYSGLVSANHVFRPLLKLRRAHFTWTAMHGRGHGGGMMRANGAHRRSRQGR